VEASVPPPTIDVLVGPVGVGKSAFVAFVLYEVLRRWTAGEQFPFSVICLHMCPRLFLHLERDGTVSQAEDVPVVPYLYLCVDAGSRYGRDQGPVLPQLPLIGASPCALVVTRPDAATLRIVRKHAMDGPWRVLPVWTLSELLARHRLCFPHRPESDTLQRYETGRCLNLRTRSGWH
jgi:hypothetical protein